MSVWDEKPNPSDKKYWAESKYGDVTLDIFTGEYFEDEDAWLEKLKAHYDRLEGIVGSLEEMGVLAVYDMEHWSTDYATLKEKAEKWDEIKDICERVPDNHTSSAGLYHCQLYKAKYEGLMSGNQMLRSDMGRYRKWWLDERNKLEAVKNIIKEYNDNTGEREPVPTKGLSEAYEAFLRIEEILEAEG